MSGQVLIERTGFVLRFTLANPDNGNEITGEMFDAMLAELQTETSHPTARVLHIRAVGSNFCLGRERSARKSNSVRSEVERLVRFKQLLRRLPLVTVAEVQGDAFGFGFGMAILSDFTFVSEKARLCFPEIKMGLAPAAIMSYLAEYMPIKQAFALVVTGELLPPYKAVEYGLINEVVAPEKLSGQVNQLISTLLNLDTEAVRNCKEFFQTSLSNSFDQNARLAVDSLTIGSLNMMNRLSE